MSSEQNTKFRNSSKVQKISLNPATTSMANPSNNKTPNRLRLNQKISYYTEKPAPLTNLQNKGSFVMESGSASDTKFGNTRQDFRANMNIELKDFPEFDTVRENHIIVTIEHWYNPFSDTSRKNDESQEIYEKRLKEIKDIISRRYPFIEILEKTEIEEEDKKRAIHGLFDIQICINSNGIIQKEVLYSKLASKALPNPKIISDAIRSYLKTQSVVVKLIKPKKSVKLLGEEGCYGNNESIQGLQIILRQKDSTLNQLNIETSQAKGQQSINLFLSPRGKSINATDNKTRTRSLSAKKSDVTTPKSKNILEPRNTIGIFVAKEFVDGDGIAIFQEVVVDIKDYEIEIVGNGVFKSKKLNFKFEKADELLAEKVIPIALEYDSIVIGKLNISLNKKEVKDAVLRISNIDFVDEKNQYLNNRSKFPWVEVIEYNEEDKGYTFFSRHGSYYIEISKKNCRTVNKQVHFKKGEYNLDVELVADVLSTISFKTYNIFTSQKAENVELKIFNEDGATLASGFSNKEGIFQCNIQMLETIKVYAKKQNFLPIQHTFQILSQTIGNVYNVFLLPQNMELKSQFEILIYIPHKDFKIDFYMKLPDGSLLNREKKEKDNCCFYDELIIGDQRLIEFSLQKFKETQGSFYELFGFSKLKAPNVRDSTSPVAIDLPQCESIELNLNDNLTPINMLSTKSSAKKESTIGSGSKSPQTSTSFFLTTRLSSSTQTKGSMLSQTGNPKYYINENIKNFIPNDSIKIFAIYDNEIKESITISQNILINPKAFGRFDGKSKVFSLSTTYQLMGNGTITNKETITKNKENGLAESLKKVSIEDSLLKSSTLKKSSKEIKSKILGSAILGIKNK